MVNRARISIGKGGGYVGIMWDYVGLCGIFYVNGYTVGFGYRFSICFFGVESFVENVESVGFYC
jgi:hypothetical protein